MSDDRVVLTPTPPVDKEVELLQTVFRAVSVGGTDLANQVHQDPGVSPETRAGLINGMALLVGYYRLRVDRYGSGMIQASLGELVDLGIGTMNRIIEEGRQQQAAAQAAAQEAPPEPVVEDISEFEDDLSVAQG